MSVTVTPQVHNEVFGDKRVTVTDVTFDASYVGGGEPLTPADLHLQKVDFATSQVKIAGAGNVTAVFYDIANEKLLAYAAGAEIAGAVDIHTVVAQVVAYGS